MSSFIKLLKLYVGGNLLFFVVENLKIWFFFFPIVYISCTIWYLPGHRRAAKYQNNEKSSYS